MNVKKLLKTIGTDRFAPLTLALLIIIIVLLIIIIVKPDLEKGDGWLGVKVRQNESNGFLIIEEVIYGSPAFDVGMLPGDLIISYKGVRIKSIRQLHNLINRSYINQLIRIVIKRNGKRLIADIRLKDRPENIKLNTEVIIIDQGATPPHGFRGKCLNCHSIVPPGTKR